MRLRTAVLVIAMVLFTQPAKALGLSLLDYQELSQKGDEKTLNMYLTTIIDTIGVINEAIKDRGDKPIFCQDRVITINLIRGSIDHWIVNNQPTKSSTEWRTFSSKQNLAVAILLILQGAMPCSK
jgi:hypothetical protein